MQHHLRFRELPACYFPNDAKRTCDRFFEYFARLVAIKKV
ncbi:MAG: hypothetical protein WAL93_08610 [Desulfobacterales bacterium]